jgi:hypothetical protein
MLCDQGSLKHMIFCMMEMNAFQQDLGFIQWLFRSYTAVYSPSLISKTLRERHFVCTTGHFWSSRCEHQLNSISCVSKTLNLGNVILSPRFSESWRLIRVKFQVLASWWGITRWWIPAPSPTTTSYFWLPFFLRFSSPPCSLNPKP